MMIEDKMIVEQQERARGALSGKALRCLVVAPLVGLLLLILAATGLASTPADEAATALVIDPPAQLIVPGETVTTAVRVEDVENLYTFEFHLSFDPAVIEGIQVVPGGFLSPDWQLDNTIDNDEGTISYALSQLNPSEPVTGTGALAIITWRGVTTGTTAITFTHQELYHPGGGAPIPATTQGGQIAVGEGEPPPTIASLNPTSTLAGGPGLDLTVEGARFIPESVVHWDGEPRTTAFVSSTRLTAQISAADVSTGGTFDVRVVNPILQGGTSGAETFTVSNPAPAITSLSPVSTTAQAPAFTLTVNGERFVEGSTVLWDGAPRPTTFLSSTRLTAAISSFDVRQMGVISVSVQNPEPGGGTSSELPFEIAEPGLGANVVYLPISIRGGS